MGVSVFRLPVPGVSWSRGPLVSRLACPCDVFSGGAGRCDRGSSGCAAPEGRPVRPLCPGLRVLRAGCFHDRGSPGADIATFDPQSRNSLVTVVGLFCFMPVRPRSAGCSPAMTRGHGPRRPAARRGPARLRAGRQRRPCQFRNADGGECRLTSRQVHSAAHDPRSLRQCDGRRAERGETGRSAAPERQIPRMTHDRSGPSGRPPGAPQRSPSMTNPSLIRPTACVAYSAVTPSSALGRGPDRSDVSCSKKSTSQRCRPTLTVAARREISHETPPLAPTARLQRLNRPAHSQ
jgi:hypothetical protein